VAAPVVSETSALAVAQAMSVEMVFRDIDADGVVEHLFRAFACHSALAPEYQFRPKEKTRADGQHYPDPTLAADERAATLSRRFLLASAARIVIRQA
jgi:hypothetical protein